jgi:low molecular weight protein-tyrosine phosphatase
MGLPAPREPGARYRVAVVCLGNICRSPMAHVVLTAKLAESALAGAVDVDSSGTGDWHLGSAMDDRAAAALDAAGYHVGGHRSQLFTASWFDDNDLVVVMDSSNRRDVLALAREDSDRARVRMLREFDPEAGDELDVPDPWYGGQSGFDDVLAMIERSTDLLIAELEELLAPADR